MPATQRNVITIPGIPATGTGSLHYGDDGGSMTDSGVPFDSRAHDPHSSLRLPAIRVPHNHCVRSRDPLLPAASLAVQVVHRCDSESELAWQPIPSAEQPEASESSPSKHLPQAGCGSDRVGQSGDIPDASGDGLQHSAPLPAPPPPPPSPQASGDECSAGAGAQADVDYELLTQVIGSLEGEIHELKFLVDRFKQVRRARKYTPIRVRPKSMFPSLASDCQGFWSLKRI